MTQHIIKLFASSSSTQQRTGKQNYFQQQRRGATRKTFCVASRSTIDKRARNNMSLTFFRVVIVNARDALKNYFQERRRKTTRKTFCIASRSTIDKRARSNASLFFCISVVNAAARGCNKNYFRDEKRKTTIKISIRVPFDNWQTYAEQHIVFASSSTQQRVDAIKIIFRNGSAGRQ